jgi:hypothetical protein
VRLILPIALAILTLVRPLPAAEPAPSDGRAAVVRGLVFLASDARAWKAEHGCVSCHHAALIAWAMREARGRDYKVDEPLLAELTRWTAESGEGKTGVPRPEGIPNALNTPALYYALALAGDPALEPSSLAGRGRLLTTLRADQNADGSWSAWPETRPPFFGGSNETMTAIAAIALSPAASSGDESAKSALERAVGWLAATKTDDDPQSVALRLLVWLQSGRPADEWQPLVERIKGRQNADGGWSQAADMTSDAWATGQALYALASAGLKSDQPAIIRGRLFLTRAQRGDGSWPMTSRPIKPGGTGSTSLIPITGAGSAWAVLGLVRSG